MWYLLFYLAITLFNIPHLTWGGEITSVSEQKNTVYGFRNYAGYGGMILFALVPILPFSEGTKVTPETMRYLVVVAAVLVLPTLYCLMRYVPASEQQGIPKTEAAENPYKSLLALRHNIPLVWFVGVMVLNSVAGAFYIGLKFMMMDAYLGQGQYYVHFLLFHLVVAALAIKPAMRVIAAVGKLRAIKIWGILSLAAFASLSLVLLNNAATLVLFALFNIIWSFSSAIGNVAIFSLLSDVADYGTLKTGVDRSAMCFSLQSLAGKTALAIGISLSIALAGLMGFDPALAEQGEQAFWALVICMSIVPALLSLLVVILVERVGITESPPLSPIPPCQPSRRHC
ncbi:MFS transporter [Oceanicoccus sagamiensis]|uniref:Major facilitator superfamily (MFS) profile domain-containing protein n=1 Tax=Oceanicoccus sagamiensis TaxID=716816 RepID=A0A1X9N9F4_9GAMM|nr:MFS transporter [Oceanicoccus sagamiensis]ARN73811.1 hypothetical protein BST96_06605 [Oceanicoccus sagamiensis]